MLKTLKGLPLAVLILVGLSIGAAAGFLLPQGTHIEEAVAAIGLAGQLWLQALQMTILPLVFALLSTIFVRSHGVKEGGRTTVRSLATIIGLYVVGMVIGVVTTILLLDLSPVSEASARAMRSMAGEGLAAEKLPWAESILALVPTNIVSAMAGDSLLPVLVFTFLFGAAITRIEGPGKQVLIHGLTALADTVFVIVAWVLKLAPVGVGLLILPTTYLYGADIFGGFAHYIALAVVQMLVALACVYALVMLLTRVPVARFARAILPVQAVAFGTQSSTGCMPLTLKATRDMGVSDEAANVTVPLAAVIFRIIGPTAAIFISGYAAAVYGLEFGVGLMVVVGLVAIAVEMSVVGLPGTAIFVATVAPFAAIVGFPIAFIGVLIVVEVIPDIFKTIVNVTAHSCAAGIVDRGVEAKPIEA